MKKLIVTVCKGNIHRSVVAALCIQKCLAQKGLQDQYLVISRGLQGSAGTAMPKYVHLSSYPMEWSLTEPVLRELGITVPATQVATPITFEIAQEASIIIAMDSLVLRTLPNSLVRQFPELEFKMKLFSNLYGSDEDIEDCGGSDNKLLHELVNRQISTMVHEHLYRLIEFVNSMEN